MKTNRLEAIVALGKKRYILLHGVLGWGLLTAALFTGWSFFTKERMSTSDVVIPFVIFPIGGLFWGMFMWSVIQKRLREAQAARSAQ